MTKEDVYKILKELRRQQMDANLGGIIGGKEYEDFARSDLETYSNAVKWFDKNVMKNSKIK